MVLQKEYRIVMPVSVEEYRCAQVYMTSRTSLSEAMDAEGASVEILANRPEEHPRLGRAQYTKKIFHIDKRFPSWLRMVAPKSGSYLLEESWNAYPRTITEVTFPMFSSFRITVESEHLPDRGTGNPHGLDKKARKACEVVHIDISRRKESASKEQDSSDHSSKEEEIDLSKFRSKCGRGPLAANWQRESEPVMCAYKKVSCQIQIWGMQSKVENFMHAYELDLFHKANRNTFCWIDEWHGLTMPELRRFESDVQKRINLITRVKQGKEQAVDLASLAALRAFDYKGRCSPIKHSPVPSLSVGVTRHHSSASTSAHDASAKTGHRSKTRGEGKATQRNRVMPVPDSSSWRLQNLAEPHLEAHHTDRQQEDREPQQRQASVQAASKVHVVSNRLGMVDTAALTPPLGAAHTPTLSYLPEPRGGESDGQPGRGVGLPARHVHLPHRDVVSLPHRDMALLERQASLERHHKGPLQGLPTASMPSQSPTPQPHMPCTIPSNPQAGADARTHGRCALFATPAHARMDIDEVAREGAERAQRAFARVHCHGSDDGGGGGERGRGEEEDMVVRWSAHQRAPSGMEGVCCKCPNVGMYSFDSGGVQEVVCSVECKLILLAAAASPSLGTPSNSSWYTHTHTHTHTHTRTHTRTHIHAHTCVHTHTHTCTHAHTRTHMHARTRTYTDRKSVV